MHWDDCLSTHDRSKWPKDRWHAAIRIQSWMRVHLAKRFLGRLQRSHADELHALQHDADREEAAILIQTCYRRYRAVQCCTQKRLSKAVAEQERIAARCSVPELFSVYDLPESWFDWSSLLLSTRRFGDPVVASETIPRPTDDLKGWRVCGARSLLQWCGDTAERSIQQKSSDGSSGASSAATTVASRMVFPHPQSTVLVDQARLIFAAIDTHNTGFVAERYLKEIVSRVHHSPPQLPHYFDRRVAHNDDNKAARDARCTQLVERILKESGRWVNPAATNAASPPPNALTFNEFCRFMMLLLQT